MVHKLCPNFNPRTGVPKNFSARNLQIVSFSAKLLSTLPFTNQCCSSHIDYVVLYCSLVRNGSLWRKHVFFQGILGKNYMKLSAEDFLGVFSLYHFPFGYQFHIFALPFWKELSCSFPLQMAQFSVRNCYRYKHVKTTCFHGNRVRTL